VHVRHLVPFVSFVTGCQVLEQPEKMAAVEKQLAEMTAALEEVRGESPEEASEEGPSKKEEGQRKAKGKAKKKARDHEPETPDATHVAGPWGYQGEHGPEAWGGACASGQAQSPIDILPRPASAPEMFFVYRPTAGTVVDTGHTLQVDVEPGSYVVLDGARFDLVQFHVHTPSEHTIAGERYPLEIHFVHRDRDGALAVVGVLFDEGDPAKAMLPVWSAAPRTGGKAKLARPVDPEGLLPAQRSAFRYDGSLTTPPCTEGVRWIVLRHTRTEDAKHIGAVRARFGENARPVQELGERQVR
jgi:carbonic anhydrase